jgi:hypothetical protein
LKLLLLLPYTRATRVSDYHTTSVQWRPLLYYLISCIVLMR